MSKLRNYIYWLKKVHVLTLTCNDIASVLELFISGPIVLKPKVKWLTECPLSMKSVMLTRFSQAEVLYVAT